MIDTLRNITIGCIGTGNMGSAIISGLVKSVGSEQVICYDSDPRVLAKACGSYPDAASDSSETLCRRSDIIIVAVKPDAAL
ncbi:MAG TPA: NAD(P)-binding domain-containing protein, partial [Spirochaetota bacterium]|nr:NAD(P)-binding domain-containing protein [Spirochaetota bacterium]